ncbi:transcriptional regulator [Lutibacter sp. B2]|nr:transcriptional regulator [Lutibacter sp. B2]MBF8984031.1 transcriptional regulator [Lutibacter sp. B2]
MTIGGNFQKERLLLGLSLEAFAKKIGLTRNAINNYELRITQPSREALLKLIKIIDKDYLCDDAYLEFILSDYPNIIKKWRGNHHLSLRQAAKILEVSSSAINSLERQVYTIDRKNYDKLKKHIEV